MLKQGLLFSEITEGMLIRDMITNEEGIVDDFYVDETAITRIIVFDNEKNIHILDARNCRIAG